MGNTYIGGLVIGTDANKSISGRLTKGGCSEPPSVYQHLAGDSRAVVSQIVLNLETDLNGNALVYSAGAFALQAFDDASIQLHDLDGNLLVCLDKNNVVEGYVKP